MIAAIILLFFLGLVALAGAYLGLTLGGGSEFFGALGMIIAICWFFYTLFKDPHKRF